MIADILRGSPQPLQANSGIVSLLDDAIVLQDSFQLTMIHHKPTYQANLYNQGTESVF
jgi:hypothetical protein